MATIPWSGVSSSVKEMVKNDSGDVMFVCITFIRNPSWSGIPTLSKFVSVAVIPRTQYKSFLGVLQATSTLRVCISYDGVRPNRENTNAYRRLLGAPILQQHHFPEPLLSDKAYARTIRA